MIMANSIEEYFDSLAPSWDGRCRKEADNAGLLLRSVGIQKGDRVLDIACGTGVITGMLHSLSGAPVVGIDLSEKMTEQAKKNYAACPWASFLHGDFLVYQSKIPFDAVVLFNAYPHFIEPKKLALALANNLKTGGRFAILHTLSREELKEHHKGLSKDVSRDLKSVKEEAAYFEPLFTILEAEEDDASFRIIGAKK